ncbi:MAG: hypothetical protein WAM88_06620 [Nitrososphaeraceae archaeon]
MGVSRGKGHWHIVTILMVLETVNRQRILDSGGGKVEHLRLWIRSNGGSRLEEDLTRDLTITKNSKTRRKLRTNGGDSSCDSEETIRWNRWSWCVSAYAV